MTDKRGCSGCVHYRTIGMGGPENRKSRVCHYLLDTGHARILICPPGRKCTVKRTTGDIERKPLAHKYDARRRTTQVQRYIELYKSGFTDREIAAATSVSIQAVINWRSRRDLKPNKPRKEK